MIRCGRARAFIASALERELALEQRFRLDEHTARCPACAEHERRARALQELLEGPGDPPPVAPDVDAAVRSVFVALDRGLDRGPDRDTGRAFRPRRALRAGWIAAGALAAGTLAVAPFLLDAERPRPALASAASASAANGATPWSAARVEVAVRSALLESFGRESPSPPGAVCGFLAATREAARAGWPVRRFVEGLLACPDAAVAARAARCLGALGDPAAAAALERALRRAELADETLVALGDLGALGTPGEPAVDALERSLAQPALATRALRELCRVGGARAAAVIERAARDAREGASPSREALLDALTTTGASAVASLLRLAAERADERTESSAILARLPLVAGAGPELAHYLSRERVSEDILLRALALLQPPEALPWLEERCATHRGRAEALEIIAGLPGPEPLASVLRLEEGGRVPRAELLALLGALLERDAARAEPFTRELVARGDGASARAWLALLIESGHPRAAPALVPLVFCDALADDDRQWAALAVGELGTEADGALLADELAGRAARTTGDRRRTAACLLSIHALLGARGVERVLAPCSAASRRPVLAALEGAGRPGEAVLIHRVARALDGALSELAAVPVTRKEIL